MEDIFFEREATLLESVEVMAGETHDEKQGLLERKPNVCLFTK